MWYEILISAQDYVCKWEANCLGEHVLTEGLKECVWLDYGSRRTFRALLGEVDSK